MMQGLSQTYLHIHQQTIHMSMQYIYLNSLILDDQIEENEVV